MFQHIFRTTFRSLRKNKLYTALNLFGLAFGMTCFLLLALYVADEWTFDAFHRDAGRIYRIIEQKQEAGKAAQHQASVALRVSRSALAGFPEVENACALTQMGRMVYRDAETDRSFYEPMVAAEQRFFQILDFPFIQGNPETALTAPGSVVLVQEFAQRLFGDQNPIGKQIATDRNLTLTVTGVLAPLPVNSHLQFPALIAFSSLQSAPWYSRFESGDWSSNFFPTYFKLNAGADPAVVANKLTQLVKANYPADKTFQSKFELQPLRAAHFHSADFQNDLQLNVGNRRMTFILASIALFILLIACINYMNLTTARSETYGREVGIRKVVGAGRTNLFGRFFSESMVLTGGAFLLAWVFTTQLLPAFNAFAGKGLSLDVTANVWLLPLVLSLLALVGLIAGVYPSVYLTRIAPTGILKGSGPLFTKKQGGRGTLRKALVVFQFTLSISLMVATLVAYRQMDYIRKMDLGFNQDQVVVVDINSRKVREGFQAIKDAYAKTPAVQSVSVSNRVPGEWKVLTKAQVRNQVDGAENQEVFLFATDDAFLKTFEIELLDGRNLDMQRAGDTSAILLNEQAAKMLGIDHAAEQWVTIPASISDGIVEPLDQPFTARVVGIVRDFHFQSLHQAVQPAIVAHYRNPVDAIDYFTARISATDVDATLAAMQRTLHGVDPTHLFEYHFLNEQIAHQYENERRQSSIFSLAASCAIMIACLGLFGLAAFTASRRTKEIGIRKVLGASVTGVVALLSKEFIFLVLLGFGIATPLSWYMMQQWLDNFAYRIDIGWTVFALAGITAIGIAFLTVGAQSVKAALSNPVNSLHHE